MIITLVTWAGQKWILQIYLVLGPLCDVLSSAVTARRVKVLVLHFVYHHLVAHLVSSVKTKHTSRCETYHICEQRRLRRACISAESRQSLRCLLTHYRELSRGSFGQRARWMDMHERLKNHKPHNSKDPILMRRLKYTCHPIRHRPGSFPSTNSSAIHN